MAKQHVGLLLCLSNADVHFCTRIDFRLGQCSMMTGDTPDAINFAPSEPWKDGAWGGTYSKGATTDGNKERIRPLPRPQRPFLIADTPFLLLKASRALAQTAQSIRVRVGR
jgi:hypothetical protein